jgi:two-component system NarL family response regulator
MAKGDGRMRVLLADDHRLLLEGLANLLDAHGIEVVGMARDGLEVLALARSLKPDLILMDIRMPNCDGLKATRLIKAEMPEVKIVILTTSTEDQDLLETVRSGACGYLLKSMDAEELVEALHQAQAGILPFSPGLAKKLLDEFAQRGRPEVKDEAHLTDRQREVLELVAEGLSYKEIGVRLSLSPRTIKYHMAEIMQRLHLDHRAQVLAYAGRIGLGKDTKEE